MLLSLLKTLARTLTGYGMLVGVLVLVHYPYDSDDRKDTSDDYLRQTFYDTVYSPPKTPVNGKNHSDYVEFDQKVAGDWIKGEIKRFVKAYGLEKKKLLEVGSGSGTLQDMVDDYTGLDLSKAAERFYHKPFVAASATKMPFASDTFDGLWSVWMLEHVPNPELAMNEMRRVTKDGGYLYFFPAWNVSYYAAQGYRGRPYSDFDWRGKLTKASTYVGDSSLYQVALRFGVRTVRRAETSVSSGPTKLRFKRREPNYKDYWEADSDGVVAIDSDEAYLWFQSRGDECLNCQNFLTTFDNSAMVIKVHKR